MKRQQRIAGGISLIEAVVALAIIAFGMLAYVGLQSSMRSNSDVAKQRAEAVRIAQQAIEEGRAYAFVETTAGQIDYADLVAGSAVVQGDNGNFTLQRTVTDAATTTDPLLIGAAPRMKTLTVDVGWQDRNGETQNVRLSTTVAASPPELAGTLALPIRNGGAHGRHAAIPASAKNVGQGLSGYKPPGAAGASMVLVFNNATGLIVGVCNSVATGQAALTLADVQGPSCSSASGWALRGFVRFSAGLAQPQAADAENPSSLALGLGINLALTGSGLANPAYGCFTDAPTSVLRTQTVVQYFCSILFQSNVTTPSWSGMSTLLPAAFTDSLTPPNPPDPAWQLADNAADARSTRYRVCRYTPAANDAQLIPNQLHPRTYVNVGAGEALTNQNFLVIRAGDDTTPFICPTDVSANPATGDFVNSNTLVHQP